MPQEEQGSELQLAEGGGAPAPADSQPERYRARLQLHSLEMPGALALGQALESDPRPPVSDPNAPPFSSICLIHGMVAKGLPAREAGTGWLIHPRIVITSAHVLADPVAYSGVPGKRAAFARLWFGMGAGERWGDMANYRIHPHYSPTATDSDRFDIAAIILPSAAPIAPLASASVGDSATAGRTVGLVGFPFGERPMKSGEGVAHPHGPLLRYGVTTYPGDSGGPVFLTDGEAPVIAVHTALRGGTATANRLRAELLDPLIGDLVD